MATTAGKFSPSTCSVSKIDIFIMKKSLILSVVLRAQRN